MQSLIVDDFGTYLGKRSERVSVRYRDKDREKEEHALMDLDQIVITSRGVSMSSDLIEACTERGIEIAFLSFKRQTVLQNSTARLDRDRHLKARTTRRLPRRARTRNRQTIRYW